MLLQALKSTKDDNMTGIYEQLDWSSLNTQAKLDVSTIEHYTYSIQKQ